MKRLSLIFVATICFVVHSFSGVAAQDVDYDNLTLGIYGNNGEFEPELRFFSRSLLGAHIMRLQGGTKGLGIYANSAIPSVFVHDQAITRAIGVTNSGVGIGRLSPQVALHVFADSGGLGSSSDLRDARVLVENASRDTALRTMFELVNNGPSRFEFANTNSGQTWTFQTNASDSFMINRLGSGGNEFSIRKNGRVTMGPAGTLNFDLQPNGNLNLAGTLNQLSDRNAKKAIRAIDPSDILQKVAALSVSSWQYKDDDSAVRHIGPMAQDFRNAFGLGQYETSIATVDADGIALAAIQARKKRKRRVVRSGCQPAGKVSAIGSLGKSMRQSSL